MVDVAAGAREHLVVTGSRRREKAYLAAIETVVAQHPDLVHYRVLHGPPRHLVLADHLLRLARCRRHMGGSTGGVSPGRVQPVAVMGVDFVVARS